jgi:hypothetical protein
MKIDDLSLQSERDKMLWTDREMLIAGIIGLIIGFVIGVLI